MHIGIYARYSSDLQNSKSTQDQINDCKRYAASKFKNCKFTIFQDDAISGKNSNRQGYQTLLDAIRENSIELVLAEGLDRFARNIVDNGQFFKICEHRKIPIHTIQENEVDILKVSFKGVMNEIYTNSLGHQVKRSQRNRALEGKIFGLSYGYSIKIENGREVTGDRVINVEQAKVIREIFNMYADGHSIKSIVRYLNAQNIPSPAGKQWSSTSIWGKRIRNDGILNKKIYRGFAIWNLTTLNVNPETNVKNYDINDASEQVKVERPDLRIISEELWAKCEKRKIIDTTRKIKPQKRVHNPLYGIIFCGLCYGKKTIANAERNVCSNYRTYRTCTNARGSKKSDILNSIFSHLFTDFKAKKKSDFFKSLRINIDPKLQNKLNDIDLTINQLVSLIDQNGIRLEQVMIKLEQLQSDRKNVQAEFDKEIQSSDEEHITKVIFNGLCKLRRDLKEPQKNDKNHIILKALIESVIYIPTDKRNGEHEKITLRENRWTAFYNFIK